MGKRRMPVPSVKTMRDASNAFDILRAMPEAERARLHVVAPTTMLGRVALPESASRLLLDMLAHLSAGRTVRLAPAHRDLSTQEGADWMGMSRTTFIRFLAFQEIDVRWAGRHRRIPADELLPFVRGDILTAPFAATPRAKEPWPPTRPVDDRSDPSGW